VVFGVYLLVAVGVTIFQMRSEYLSTKQSIIQDVNNLAVSLRPALSAALWTFNDTLLDAVLVGLDNIPFVTGYEIRNRHGEQVRAGGIILDAKGLPVDASPSVAAGNRKTQPPPKLYFLPPYSFALSHVDQTGRGWDVGQVTFYIAEDVVVGRVVHGFMLILVNSVVKTAALWVIFLFFANRLLHRPLNLVTAQVQRIDTQSLGYARVSTPGQCGNELAILGESFNQLLDKLAVSRQALQQVNLELEERVRNRTEVLDKVNGELREQVVLNAKIFATSSIGVLVCRPDGSFKHVNEGMASMVGGSVPQVRALNFRQLESWRTSGLLTIAEAVLHTGESQEANILLNTSFTKILWVQVTLSRFSIKGKPHLLAVFVNITDLKLAESKLEQLARVDGLTQWLNRRAFMESGEEEVRRATRYKHQLAVLMMDLDNFKAVNDNFGHAAGDAVLVAFADIGRGTTRTGDILGRLGGEEFCLLLPETDVEQAMQVAERYRLAMQALETVVGSQTCRVTISIGVAVLPLEAETSLQELLGQADAALYKAKASGRNRVELAPGGAPGG
jgi:diguanylate cyclase (GGDEF)-like protein